MNTEQNHDTRSLLWLIPVFCSFVGINSLGTAIAGTNTGHVARSEAMYPPNQGVENMAAPGLVGYVPGSAYLLEFFMKSLSNILDDPTLGSNALDGVDELLKDSADSLILGYPLFGIDPSITNSEIETGLDDAYIVIDILKNEPELVNLDQDTQFELMATAEAIIEELEDEE